MNFSGPLQLRSFFSLSSMRIRALMEMDFCPFRPLESGHLFDAWAQYQSAFHR